MANLLRFVWEGGSYLFPGQVTIQPHQSNAVTRTTRLPGLSGGHDEYGDEAAPLAIGDIRATWWLDVRREGKPMVELRDTVLSMVDAGAGWLVADFEGRPRRIRIRENNINISIDNKKMAHVVQKVEANFQAKDPRWVSKPGAIYFDEGYSFNTGQIFGGSRYSSASVTGGDVITLVNNGNARTPLYMRVKMTSATPTQIEASHVLPGGRVVAGWRWIKPTVANDVLIVDAARGKVIHDATTGIVSGYPQWTPLYGKGFIMLRPGSNRIELAGWAGNVTVEMDYDDAWR